MYNVDVNIYSNVWDLNHPPKWLTWLMLEVFQRFFGAQVNFMDAVTSPDVFVMIHAPPCVLDFFVISSCLFRFWVNCLH